MNLNASIFSKGREKALALTQKRVKQILVCVINSYEKIIADGVVFDFNDRGTYSQEDYLTSELVENYFQNELDLLNSGTTDYSVAGHNSEEKYYDDNDKPRPDKIDIQIVDTALKNSLAVQEKTYFAIECKRLGSISEYVNDTKKITERNHKMFRLPFEGQLGFIENPDWNYETVKDKVNDKLSKNSTIETTKLLEAMVLKEKFDGSYYSEHKKINKIPFSVFHLFFNYSKIVLN
ncbi:MAG: hypothetical protein H6607_03690 [Flavobacteriales bacterium]|nr:hypothetical protein [Flavobacteriales bacterium]